MRNYHEAVSERNEEKTKKYFETIREKGLTDILKNNHECSAIQMTDENDLYEYTSEIAIKQRYEGHACMSLNARPHATYARKENDKKQRRHA